MAFDITKYINDKIDRTSDLKQIGIGEFLLYIALNETFGFNSTSPDITVENGSVVQDHIINQPKTLSIEGVIGDIFLKQSIINDYLRKANVTIGQINDFLPEYTQSQIQANNELISNALDRAEQINSYIQAGENILDIIGNRTGASSIQEQFIDKMEFYYQNKELITIGMPYRQFQNMRITDISFTRDNTSNSINFRLQAKQITFANTIIAESSTYFPNVSKGLNGQTAPVVNKGVQSGKKETSILFSALGF